MKDFSIHGSTLGYANLVGNALSNIHLKNLKEYSLKITNNKSDALTFHIKNAQLSDISIAGENVKEIVLDVTEGKNTLATVNANSTSNTPLLKKISITGDAEFTLYGYASTISTIDGSAATGKLSLHAINSDSKLVIQGGAGNDTFIAAEGAASVTFTGGEGNDIFNVSTATTGSDSVDTSHTMTITDLEKGETIIFQEEVAKLQKITLEESVTTLKEAFSKLENAGNDVLQWFEFEGNTYLVRDDGNGVLSENDTVVQLTGIVDLTDAAVSKGVLTV